MNIHRSLSATLPNIRSAIIKGLLAGKEWPDEEIAPKPVEMPEGRSNWNAKLLPDGVYVVLRTTKVVKKDKKEDTEIHVDALVPYGVDATFTTRGRAVLANDPAAAAQAFAAAATARPTSPTKQIELLRAALEAQGIDPDSVLA